MEITILGKINIKGQIRYLIFKNNEYLVLIQYKKVNKLYKFSDFTIALKAFHNKGII